MKIINPTRPLILIPKIPTMNNITTNKTNTITPAPIIFELGLLFFIAIIITRNPSRVRKNIEANITISATDGGAKFNIIPIITINK